MALIDRFGRTISYLRVSVTDRCNLFCDYCRSGRGPMLPNNDKLLTLEEITRLVDLFTQLGIEKIRLTGGEPLLRRNVVSLIRGLHGLPLLREISLSTNALLLGRLAVDLKNAGLRRVNISLDSLNPATFAQITGGGDLGPVLTGIDAAIAAGLHPVKVNMVVMRGVNDGEVVDMVAFAKEKGVMLRFIETMPVGEAGRETADRFVSAEEILAVIRQRWGAELIPVHQIRGAGPARYFRLPGTEAEIGVISARSRHFCDSCNRMRLTSKGNLVLCLGREDRMDLKTLLRQGVADQVLKDKIQEAVQQKPARHLFDESQGEGKTFHLMSALGG